MSTARKTTKTATPKDDVLLVTQERYDDMTTKLEYYRDVVRDEIAQAINEARDLGDLSENNAYSDAMEKKDINEARIEELEYMISIAQIVEAEQNSNIVSVGSTVEIQKVGGDKRVVTLVGKSKSQEADPAAGKFSEDSPLGIALNMAQVGDTVSVKTPSGQDIKYKILRKVS